MKLLIVDVLLAILWEMAVGNSSKQHLDGILSYLTYSYLHSFMPVQDKSSQFITSSSSSHSKIILSFHVSAINFSFSHRNLHEMNQGTFFVLYGYHWQCSSPQIEARINQNIFIFGWKGNDTVREEMKKYIPLGRGSLTSSFKFLVFQYCYCNAYHCPISPLYPILIPLTLSLSPSSPATLILPLPVFLSLHLTLSYFKAF